MRGERISAELRADASDPNAAEASETQEMHNPKFCQPSRTQQSIDLMAPSAAEPSDWRCKGRVYYGTNGP